MQLSRIIEEALLGLSIAIIIPTIAYYGINILHPKKIIEIKYMSQTAEASLPEQEQEDRRQKTEFNKLEYKTYQTVSFWVYLFTTIFTILIGSLVSSSRTRIHSLSIGLLGSGVYSLIVTISNSPGTATTHFAIFVSLLVAIITIIIIRSRTENK